MTSIVVIEDEEDIRNLLLFNLREEGFVVYGAAGAGEGLALCTMHRPDVVIVDRMLHGADGLDVCEQIRSDREIADAALLVLSARGSVDDKLTGFDSGADDYIVKPFGIDDLVVRVRKLASVAAKRKRMEQHAG
jgi:DNA-binding response OmpR family regulator